MGDIRKASLLTSNSGNFPPSKNFAVDRKITPKMKNAVRIRDGVLLLAATCLNAALNFFDVA